ncbi:hypothetical protein JTE90_017805 [Oedothorax gibbosus]|uniref:WH2 domain-containing protein n=1 Tax=Oedothorax gibbosus TaxID=931172 RepID=A0AAV6U7S3_9ARAC|nr:hypothetical protein JTE90_017805 [Oedothorax gibbosus]
MGNLCCKRVVGYSPNGIEVDVGRFPPVAQSSQSQSSESQPKPLVHPSSYHMGDDCAINELLEGRMDLDVVLPDSRKVRLTVDRRTPMMDLLVQAASATKISPAGHTIHVFGDSGKCGTLPYKPSTPIGSLDANTICIVPKKDSLDSASGKRAPKTANRPFEPTFRVQVHLPRNQLTVIRMSPRVTISELRSQVCREKGLDPLRYQLVRPSDPGQPLGGDITLAEYGSTEITLLSNTCVESHVSTAHIMSYPKDEQKTRKTTGILRLIAEDHSKYHNTKTKPQIQPEAPPIQRNYKPKKRRPAPPPPALTTEPNFHSRQSSSDSSGYHEVASSSFLREETLEEKASSDSSGVSSLDAKVGVSVAKKRKAPLPPSVGENEDKKDEGDDEDLKCVEIEDKVDLPKVEECDSSKVDVEENLTVDVLKKAAEVPEKHISKDDEAVTKAALLALNARIEQNVTEQEIASSIQAAFNDCARSEPSLLTIKTKELGSPKTDLPKYNEQRLESGLVNQRIGSLNGQGIGANGHFESLKTERQKSNEPSSIKIEDDSGVDNLLIGCLNGQSNKLGSVEVSIKRSASLKTKCDSGISSVREANGPSLGSFKKPGLVKDTSGLSNYRLESAKTKYETVVSAKVNNAKSLKKSGSDVTSSGLSNYHFGSLKCESGEQKISVTESSLKQSELKTGKRVNGVYGLDTLKKSASDEQTSVKPGLSNYSFGSLKTKSESDQLNSFVYGLNDNLSLDTVKEHTFRTTSNGLTKPFFGNIKDNLANEDINHPKSENISNNSLNLEICSVRLVRNDVTENKNSVNITVRDVSQKTLTGSSTEDISDKTCLLNKTVVSLKQESKSVSQSHTKSISITSDIPVSEKSKDFYPLQKSTVRLSFERKAVKEDPIEAFPPPPAEFRTVETDNRYSPIQTTAKFNSVESGKTASSVKTATEFRNVESGKKHSLAEFRVIETSKRCSPPRASTELKNVKPSPATTKTLRRSSSLLNLSPPVIPVKSKDNRERNLQRSLSDLSIDDKFEFEAEQERLRLEYVKLQRQFVLWQQQLMSNHAMLSEECLAPPHHARTLRQSHSLPEGEDEGTVVPCPLVSRSLSYEPTRSTLPRSAINIPSLELGPTNNASNGSSTLRSSKTKSYFKPPQVRISTKNRQRLPPEIRDSVELDINDDKKILSTILPSFDSLKLITENEDDSKQTRLENLKNSINNKKDSNDASLKLKANKLESLLNGNEVLLHLKNGSDSKNLLNNDEVKKVPPPVPNKTSSLPKQYFGQNGHIPNSDTGQKRPVNGHSVISVPPAAPPMPILGNVMTSCPPPAPPMPVNGNSGAKQVVPQKKMPEQKVDTREQLMQEIRKCGGRTALRKISLT